MIITFSTLLQRRYYVSSLKDYASWRLFLFVNQFSYWTNKLVGVIVLPLWLPLNKTGYSALIYIETGKMEKQFLKSTSYEKYIISEEGLFRFISSGSAKLLNDIILFLWRLILESCIIIRHFIAATSIYCWCSICEAHGSFKPVLWRKTGRKNILFQERNWSTGLINCLLWVPLLQSIKTRRASDEEGNKCSIWESRRQISLHIYNT